MNFKDLENSKVGMLQASGVAGYILLIAAFISNVGDRIPEPPEVLGGAAFLTLFVVSALVCGSLVLAYPATLALKGRAKDAFEVVAWSAVSLVAFLAAILLVVLAL